MQERRAVKLPEMESSFVSPAVSAGGLIFVSAAAGLGADGKVISSEIQAQTRQAIKRLGRVLEAAGSSLAQVVTVNVYLRQATDFDAMNAAYRESFSDQPPTRTTVMADLPSGVHIMISAVAVPAGATRETMHPAGWVKSPRPYSYIVRAGGFVFLSGLVSRRGTDDQVVPGPINVQTSQVLDNAATLLKTAGLTFADVVAARVYLTDDSQFEAMNDEYRRRFANDPPARATAVVGLMGNDAMVEMTFIASTQGKQIVGPAVSPSLPLSSAVRAGDFLFLSGVLGNTDQNVSDLAAQTRETFTRIHRTLDGVGLSFSHVVDNLVYITDVWQQKKLDEISREIFPLDPPARTVAGAKLVTRAGLIEMMMTAVAR